MILIYLLAERRILYLHQTTQTSTSLCAQLMPVMTNEP